MKPILNGEHPASPLLSTAIQADCTLTHAVRAFHKSPSFEAAIDVQIAQRKRAEARAEMRKGLKVAKETAEEI